MAEDNTVNDIPEMQLNQKYSPEKLPAQVQNPNEAQKDMEKTKKDLEKFKSWVIKKYSYTVRHSVKHILDNS